MSGKMRDVARLLLAAVLLLSHFSQTLYGEAWKTASLQSESPVDCVRMPVDFGELRGELVVDTGADHSLLDKRYVRYCSGGRTRVKAEDAHSISSRLSVYQFFSFRLLNEEHKLSPVGIVDLKRLQEVQGGPVIGIVGYKFLVDNHLSLGYRSEENQFYLSRGNDENHPHKFSLVLNAANRPLVSDVLIDGSLNYASSYLIDTGMNSALSISSTDYDLLMESGRLSNERESSAASLFGSRGFRRATLDKAIVLGREFCNIPINEGKGERNRIGLAMLRQFDFLLDPTSKSIHVRHPSINEQNFRCDLSGVAVIQKDVKIVVFSVQPDIFPGSAVLQSGDSIEYVNGTKVPSLAFVRHAFSTPSDSPLKLTIIRKGQILDLELPLRSPESLGLVVNTLPMANAAED